MHQPLISALEVLPQLEAPNWMLIDCRFYLADPEQGRREYEEGHLPGAVYAHLDADLSGPILPGQTGRHPLPAPTQWLQTLASWGITPDTQVVVYDQGPGGIAARVWWMLRWIGHEAVAVLDGGWQAWVGDEFPTSWAIPQPLPIDLLPFRPSMPTLPAHDLLAGDHLLLDARAAERYRGEVEPIDPVAGHIPGAISAPFAGNLGADGRFLSPEALRNRFLGLLEGRTADQLVCYCGSGVTACHNLLAMEYAGLPGASLYPGSWSEWITDPERGIE
jgi:thiosulfate/3-mercaptopyruvate sulfurtransferase